MSELGEDGLGMQYIYEHWLEFILQIKGETINVETCNDQHLTSRKASPSAE